MRGRSNKTEFWCEESAIFHFTNKQFNKDVLKINKNLGKKFLIVRPEYRHSGYSKKDSYWIKNSVNILGFFEIYIDPNLDIIDKEDDNTFKEILEHLKRLGYNASWDGNYHSAFVVRLELVTINRN